MARQRSTSSSTEEEMDLPKCTICHIVFNETVCITPCGHRFCTGCISQWLNRTPQCPTCRQPMTVRQLIPDRELPGIISRLRDMHAAVNEVAGQTENTGQTVNTQEDSDTPLWSQNMEHTKKLLQYKQTAIDDLTHKSTLADREILQLKEEIARLKGLITSVPTLKERIVQLETEVQKERRNRSQLQVKLQDATTKDAASRSSITMLKKNQTEFEKKEINYVATIQKSSDDLAHFTEENKRLISENTKLEGDLEHESKKLDEVKAENEILKLELRTALQTNNDLSVELEKITKQAMFILNRMNHLQMYEQDSAEKTKALLELNGNTLPQRNYVIDTLQHQVAKLVAELAAVRRDTLPLSEHTMKIQSEVQQTKDNLQKSYEVARDTARAYDEENRKTWQNRLIALESQLKSQNEMNELSTATPSYKKLVKKNFELEDTVNHLRKKLCEAQCMLPQDTDESDWLGREN